MEIRVTRPARKHRVGNARILAAIANADGYFMSRGVRMYIAKDDRGVELEIGLVPDDKHEGGWSVIHAMPTEYRKKDDRNEG